MWSNRKSLAKILPDTSVVTNIIDFHKTSKLNKSSELVQQENSGLFYTNLRKVITLLFF
jgi:hypothetical protein